MKVCPNCGTYFPTTMPRKQVYCTPDCRRDAQRKRIEEVVVPYTAERLAYLGERFAIFEKDGFRCTVCGRNAADGAVLELDGSDTLGYKTMCQDCKTGKDFLYEGSP